MDRGERMFQEYSLQEFEEECQTYDGQVQGVPDISTVCSGSDWQIAAYHTLHSPRQVSIWRRDDQWLLGCVGPLSPFDRVLQPLELSWAFGCPLIGPTSAQSMDFLLDLLHDEGHRWQLVLLSGIPRRSPLQEQLTEAVRPYFAMDQFPGSHCMQSDLRHGLDAFFARRSPRFRANVRRSSRKARAEGIDFEWLTPPFDAPSILERILLLEQRSWKFAAGQSIFLTPHYRHFYTQMIERMAENQKLRVLFASRDGRDLAYIFGGVMGSVYRGFQLSYDDAFAHLSLGHLSQWEMLQRLASEGVTTYDLGMAMDYKQRWSDFLLELDNHLIFL